MKYLNRIAFIVISALLIGCASSEQTFCDSSNTEFNKIYNHVLSLPSNVDMVDGDTETHSYTFEITKPKNVCSIGYQSIPAMETVAYLIELYDNTSNTLIYSGDHEFSSSATSYVSVGSIPLIVGHSYTIKRIQTNWGSNIENAMGRLTLGEFWTEGYPYTSGALKITGSYFGEEYGAVIPYIDIVFE
jgi:hypothetical protein